MTLRRENERLRELYENAVGWLSRRRASEAVPYGFKFHAMAAAALAAVREAEPPTAEQQAKLMTGVRTWEELAAALGSYRAANLRQALDLVPDTGDWHGELRIACDLALKASPCKPNPLPPGVREAEGERPQHLVETIRELLDRSNQWSYTQAAERIAEVLHREGWVRR